MNSVTFYRGPEGKRPRATIPVLADPLFRIPQEGLFRLVSGVLRNPPRCAARASRVPNLARGWLTLPTSLGIRNLKNGNGFGKT